MSELPAEQLLQNQIQGPIHIEIEFLSSEKLISFSSPVKPTFCNPYLLCLENVSHGNIWVFGQGPGLSLQNLEQTIPQQVHRELILLSAVAVRQHLPNK
jgi:hypothetical protein